jgi:hypothetical protein
MLVSEPNPMLTDPTRITNANPPTSPMPQIPANAGMANPRASTGSAVTGDAAGMTVEEVIHPANAAADGTAEKLARRCAELEAQGLSSEIDEIPEDPEAAEDEEDGMDIDDEAEGVV